MIKNVNHEANDAANRNRLVPEPFANQTYLDPRLDPAFKELFDSEDALKDFLNGVLELDGEDKIRSLSFSFDKELRFRVPQRKKIILDVFATTGTGRFLNIEMQNLEHEFFADRIVLYKAFLVIKGKKEMELSAEYKALSKKDQKKRLYELPETISIWICNFELTGAKDEYVDEWALYSKCAVKNGHAVPIFPKNRYIFFSLPNFKKSAEEVSGSLDAWLYLLNHAGDSNDLPNFGSEIIEEALDRIRVDNADEELLSDQENAMSMKEDYEIILASTEIRAREEGVQKGRAEGLAEGRDAEKRSMAKALKAMGDSIEKIAAVSGLSAAEVEAL